MWCESSRRGGRTGEPSRPYELPTPLPSPFLRLLFSQLLTQNELVDDDGEVDCDERYWRASESEMGVSRIASSSPSDISQGKTTHYASTSSRLLSG